MIFLIFLIFLDNFFMFFIIALNYLDYVFCITIHLVINWSGVFSWSYWFSFFYILAFRTVIHALLPSPYFSHTMGIALVDFCPYDWVSGVPLSPICDWGRFWKNFFHQRILCHTAPVFLQKFVLTIWYLNTSLFGVWLLKIINGN